MSNVSNIMKYYGSSFYFAIAVLMAGFAYGFYSIGTIQAGLGFMAIMAILGVLETSLSFDNAIVNAKTLETMDPIWKHRFLTYGLIIAVFGMRVIFPLLIVSVVASMGMWDSLMLAINEPHKYAEVLESSHNLIAGFGGAFLMLVSFKYFFDLEKEHHWIAPIEKALSKIGALKSSEIIITLLVMYGIKEMLPAAEQMSFFMAGVFGIIAHEVVAGLGDIMGADNATTSVAKQGLATFLYLEVLDASFSFDGVIGAFALSTNIFIIAGGLGIGAMFVRSMTLHLVDSGAMGEYRYLEAGAFWSILALASIMFINTFHEIPEMITGGLTAITILTAFIHSIYANRKEALAS